jgi:hypothetical protein
MNAPCSEQTVIKQPHSTGITAHAVSCNDSLTPDQATSRIDGRINAPQVATDIQQPYQRLQTIINSSIDICCCLCNYQAGNSLWKFSHYSFTLEAVQTVHYYLQVTVSKD